MRQIVCISTTNYHPIPTRKQNVMNRLSDAEILYIDPPVSWIAPLKDKNARERLFKWKRPGERVKDNITVYQQDQSEAAGQVHSSEDQRTRLRQAVYLVLFAQFLRLRGSVGEAGIDLRLRGSSFRIQRNDHPGGGG